jgi:hypothetical protein
MGQVAFADALLLLILTIWLQTQLLLIRHPKHIRHLKDGLNFIPHQLRTTQQDSLIQRFKSEAIKNGRRKNKTPRDRDLLGFRRHCWRRRRDSNPRSRFWPRCSLSRGVPSTSRPRLPNFRSRRESARRSQDNSGLNREGQCLRHIFCARFVTDDAICSHWPQRTHEARTGRLCTPRGTPHFSKQITPDRVRTPCEAHARRAPCTSHRSVPRS